MAVKTIPIEPVTGDAAVDLALDTIRIGKQSLIFVNSKRSAEAAAEKVAKKSEDSADLKELSEKILNVLSSPTKQCRRLAYCARRGSAFHHSGLASKQRELVELAFMQGELKTIAATPTLAAGVSIPAYRAIIRDVKRFSGAGMTAIPVLEYHQMAGRAGRPEFGDDHGQAIVVAKHEQEAQKIIDTYLHGEPEPIYSKVAAMPVLRTYVLSLIATEAVGTQEELQGFFAETFFAHQYGDLAAIAGKVADTVDMLREWGFLKGEPAKDDFASADELLGKDDELKATRLGNRVSELYIDPLTAHELIVGMKRASEHQPGVFSWLHLATSAQEMRPLMRIKMAEYEDLQSFLNDNKEDLLVLEPSIYEPDYEDFLQAVKTAMLLHEWAQERSEEELLERFGATPGELKARLDIADWLLYSCSELARIQKLHHHVSPLQKARTRLKYGVKEELLPLLKFRNIGRVRARKLHRNGVRTAEDVKKADANTLSQLLGPSLAKSIKKQVGQDVDEKALSPRKRKGQLSLDAPRFRK